MQNLDIVAVKDTTANPAPLGLLGFGMTTILLNLHNAGLFGVNSAIMGMGIFVGGLAQVVAGIQESKKNNTFGATAFTAYGFFWLSLVAIWILPQADLNVEAASKQAMGWYLLIWGIFTSGMFVGTLKSNRVSQVIFGSLAALFFLLAAGDFLDNHAITNFAGIVGIFCGAMAMYDALAQILNEIYGKELLPLGHKK
ncbi:acetate uptake transporter [Persicobacter diffluens]|uniref:Acetate uptake transporter n=1 Tax=Persicobacter diffluens TaxID=981 RepID=A0AAN5AJN9_9BACT|nr:hypothetical protein PEDI_02180 [Persicobacter diffluens]